jgi:hypothetical protein
MVDSIRQLDRLHQGEDGCGVPHPHRLTMGPRQGAEEAIDDHSFHHLSCVRVSI